MEKLTCAKAKQFDLVEYLATLGHFPTKINRQEYWYLSPLRKENTASFKVNRKDNVWYDHADGIGGNLIDFGILYFRCPVSELLERLSSFNPSANFSFHPPLSAPRSAGEKKEPSDNQILILDVRPLAEKSLMAYLEERKIPLQIAATFCHEVDFLLYGKTRTVIGFKNDAGGFELRGPDFKGSSSPKTSTFFDNGSKELNVFEGFFNYLSFLSAKELQPPMLPNFLILNSTAFFDKSQPLMERHDLVSLSLDHDKRGDECTSRALQWDSKKFIDRRNLYKGHEDLNKWLVHGRKQVIRQRPYRKGI